MTSDSEYEPPALVEYGSVADLTEQRRGRGNDRNNGRRRGWNDSVPPGQEDRDDNPGNGDGNPWWS